jgi:hypothetical protein
MIGSGKAGGPPTPLQADLTPFIGLYGATRLSQGSFGLRITRSQDALAGCCGKDIAAKGIKFCFGNFHQVEPAVQQVVPEGNRHKGGIDHREIPVHRTEDGHKVEDV